MKKRFSEAQVIGFLREAEAGVPSEGLMPAARVLGGELLPLAEQVRRHERLGRQAFEGTQRGEQPAEEAPGRVAARERSHPRGVTKKVVAAPARRLLVRHMTARGLSERRALAVVGMSASSLRYQPAPDKNVALRRRIVALAHRHRRYGAEMIYLKLRQAGHRVNHKRVERLYTEAQLQVRRRRRKKIPRGRPTAPGAPAGSQRRVVR